MTTDIMKSLIDPMFMKVNDVARLLNVSRTTIYKLMWSGELASIKVGGSRRIPVTSFQDFICDGLRDTAEQWDIPVEDDSG